jgi:hypothetical protein
MQCQCPHCAVQIFAIPRYRQILTTEDATTWGTQSQTCPACAGVIIALGQLYLEGRSSTGTTGGPSYPPSDWFILAVHTDRPSQPRSRPKSHKITARLP